ncbi:MAG: PHP-associated domain-containing protein [Chloroflexota bacterium]
MYKCQGARAVQHRGVDAHSVQGLGKGATMFRGDVRNELDLLEALRAGEFVPVEGFHVGRPTYYGGDSNGGGSPWSTST